MHRCPFAVPFALAVLAWTCALAPHATAEAARRPDRTPAPARGARSPAKAGPAGPAAPRLQAPQDSAPKPQRIRPPKGADREDAGMDVDDLLIDPSDLDDPGRGTKSAGRPPIELEPDEESSQESGGSAPTDAPGAGPAALPSSSLPPASPATEPGPVVIRGLPPRPQDAEMAAWHRRYRAAVGPLKAAIGAVVDADAAERPEHAVPACRRLAVELAAPEVAKLLPVPDLAVDLHWKRALGQLGASAGACRAGSYARTAYHLHEAGLALAQMRLALQRWGLAP